MKIDITDLLKQRGSKLQCKATEDFHFEEIEFQGPLNFDIMLTNIGREILAEGTVEGKLHLSCATCLADFLLPVKVELSEDFVPLTRAIPQAPEAAALEELSIFTFGADNELDLREAIRQTLLLNLPMRPTCREGCKGLCPACGRNWNEGDCACPRETKSLSEELWAPLKDKRKE